MKKLISFAIIILVVSFFVLISGCGGPAVWNITLNSNRVPRDVIPDIRTIEVGLYNNYDIVAFAKTEIRVVFRKTMEGRFFELDGGNFTFTKYFSRENINRADYAVFRLEKKINGVVYRTDENDSIKTDTIRLENSEIENFSCDSARRLFKVDSTEKLYFNKIYHLISAEITINPVLAKQVGRSTDRIKSTKIKYEISDSDSQVCLGDIIPDDEKPPGWQYIN